MEFSSGATDEFFGVWKHIHTHSPIPERDEIAQIVGRKVINENANYWSELSALKAIVFEMTGSSAAIESVGRSGALSRSKFTGKKAIQAARNFSQLHYNEEEFGKSNDALESVYNRKKFSIDTVSLNLTELLAAFHEEQEALEVAIEKMNRALDGDLDEVLFGGDNNSSTSKTCEQVPLVKGFSSLEVSSNSTGGGGKGKVSQAADKVCAFCHVVLPEQKTIASGTVAVSSSSTSSSRSKQLLLCSSCRVKKDKKESKAARTTPQISAPSSSSGGINGNNAGGKSQSADNGKNSTKFSRTMPDRLRSNESSLDINTTGDVKEGHAPPRQENQRASAAVQRSNNDESPNSSSTGTSPRSGLSSSSSSRFRDRLNSARYELHFLDEF